MISALLLAEMGTANIDDGGRYMMVVVADDKGAHCKPSLSPPHPPPSRDGSCQDSLGSACQQGSPNVTTTTTTTTAGHIHDCIGSYLLTARKGDFIEKLRYK